VTNVRTLIGAALALGSLLAMPAPAPAQTSGTLQAGDLRVEWEQVSMRGEWRNICGRVYNSREVPATHVFIMFDSLDDAGKTVASRYAEVIGDVPNRGSAIFCQLVPAKGVSYRVTVPRVDWGMSAGGQ
jgi:hypothetical protein